jgi:hypothetical protein
MRRQPLGPLTVRPLLAGTAGTALLLLAGLLLAKPPARAEETGRWPTTFDLPYWRRSHSAIYDPANTRLILFGGWNGRRFFNDLWALDLTPGAEGWSQIQPDGVRPRPRAWHSAIHDDANGRMILYGGRGYGGDLDDVWELDLTPGAERWKELLPAGSPPGARYGHTGVYDGGDKRLLVFGGAGDGKLADDLWSLSLTPGGEAWAELAPTGSPPQARALHSAAVDAADGRMLVVGGRGSSANLNDTWTLDLTPGSETWAPLSPSGTPPAARRCHTAIYDPGGGRLVLFGGIGSGGFLGDLWALTLTPGSEAWQPLSSSQGLGAADDAPPARAWHSATRAGTRMVMLGGFGPPGTLLDQQWTLDLATSGWTRLAAGEPVLPSYTSMNMQVEDAPEGVMANRLVGSDVEVVVKLAANSLEASQGISVTLTAHGNPLGTATACFRQADASACTPLWVGAEGEGRYRVQGVNLPWVGGDWSGQIVFRFDINQVPAEPVVDLSAQARFPGVQPERDATGALRVCGHVEALIVTNRARLYDVYPDSEVRSLLARLYELAEGEGAGEPIGAVFYVDRDNPTVAGWDNWQVDYSSEEAANTVANAIDERIAGWATQAYAPSYLLVVGDDDIVPFYRQESFGDEAAYPAVGNDYGPLNDVVANGYYLTDDVYADLDGGWERGDVELATGRISGGSVTDMLTSLENSRRGPSPDSGRAVVTSVTSPGSGGSDVVRDAILDGPDNDLVDALRDEWGVDVRNDVENPVTIETRGWSVDDLLAIMEEGFVAFQFMGHGENDILCITEGCEPRREQLTPNDVAALEGELGAHRPAVFLAGCRTGLSMAWYWDQSLVWSLGRHGASGVIAATGLTYGEPAGEVASSSETMSNQFWLGAFEGGAPAGPLGSTLVSAKRNFDSMWDWFVTEEKTVQAYALFGLPWTWLPKVDGTRQAAGVAQPPGLPRASWDAVPRQTAGDTTVVTRTVDASSWTVSTLDGFDVVEVDGLGLSRYDGGPVVPVAQWRLPLPREASVAEVAVALDGEQDLGPLDIPTAVQRPDYPGALTSAYTVTQPAVGVYPPQPYTLDGTGFDSWQMARVSVTPLLYDAASDETTLYEQMLVTVTYTSTTPVAAITLRTDQRVYLPGQAIAARAWLRNCSGADVLVTPTLAVVDPMSRTWGVQAGAPVILPAGQLQEVPMVINPSLDEGAYRLRFRARQEGEVLAVLDRDLAVLSGQLSDLSGPDALRADASGQFTVTFANARPDAAVVVVHLGILDPAGQFVSDLQPRVAVVAGNTAAALTFDWGPGGGPAGTYTAVARVLSGGYLYGPASRPVRVVAPVYLPLVRREG